MTAGGLRISELGLLSDCRSAALVDHAGAIVWWSPERFDSAAWFSSLLGAPGGRWALRPHDVRVTSRAYLPQTLVLRTRFETATGVVELSEGLLFAGGARGHAIGHDSPSARARTLVCLDGHVQIKHVFEPRPDYGRTVPHLHREGSTVQAVAGAKTLTLLGGRAAETFELQTGDRRGFVCAHGRASDVHPLLDPFAALEDTILG